MPYQAIQTLTFPLTPKAVGFDNFGYKTLRFPQKWTDIVTEINDREGRKYLSSVKRTHLEELMKSFFPELVSVNSYYWYDSWLHGIEEVSALKIRQLVFSWFMSNNERTLEKHSDIAGKVEEIISPREIEDELVWEDKTANLSDVKINDWNTAELVNNESYKLLPELLARSLTGVDANGLRRTLPFGGDTPFLRASPLDKGVELISWSPISFKGDYYSALINICLQLVPFQPVPNIAVNFGVRRWVSVKQQDGKPDKLGGGNHSVYLLNKLDGKCPVENGSRFQRTIVRKGNAKENFQLKWIPAFTELYQKFFGHGYLPDLEEFKVNPTDFINRDKTKLLMVFDYRMYHNHEVSPGLPAEDKSSLFGSIKNYFKTDFNLSPSAPVLRCDLKKSGKNLIGFAKFYKKDSAGKEFAENEIFSGTKPKKETDEKKPPKLDEEQMNELCRLRREFLAKNVGRKFRLEVWNQTDQVKDEIFKQISDTLGLRNFNWEKENGGERNVWRTPEIEIEIVVRDLEDLADALLFDETAASESEENGFNRRVEEIRRKIQKSEEPIPAIIEIKSKKFFQQEKRNRKSRYELDSKSAMRIGFARRGRLAQFINSPDDQDSQKALPNAANSSFLDSLRQVGLVGGLPIGTSEKVGWVDSMNFAAIWILKKKEKGFSKVLPVVIFIKRDEEKSEVFATAGGLDRFVPYRKFLLQIADASNLNWLNDWKTEAAKVEQFIRAALGKLAKLGGLLVLTETQNARLKWAWLKDGNLSLDSFSFDGCQSFENATDYENFRFARVRTTDQSEVPQHIVPNPETNSHGNSEGIFKLDERVFYGAAGKPATAQTTQNFTKTEKASKQVWNANLLEIIPCVLQNGDSAEDFAYLTHILRDAGLNFSDEYQLPLPLHLAELTKEFIPEFALEKEPGDL